MKDGIVIKLEGLRHKVRSFFSLPLPKAVWENAKVFQNDNFVNYVGVVPESEIVVEKFQRSL